MTVVELTSGDFERFGLDPARDRPLTAPVVDGLRRSLASWLGVRDGAVIAFPFASLAPLPHPRRPRPDGTGRLPPTVSPAGARHPAWWLDAASSRRAPDESLLAYGVRLSLDLRARGLTGPDGEALDALAPLGWDDDDPRCARRIRTYARGGCDAQLCRLTLPLPAGPPGTTTRRRAEAYLAPRLALLGELERRLEEAGSPLTRVGSGTTATLLRQPTEPLPRRATIDESVLPPAPP